MDLAHTVLLRKTRPGKELQQDPEEWEMVERICREQLEELYELER